MLSAPRFLRHVCLAAPFLVGALLVAALHDSNLHIIDFSKNQQEVVIKGGCNFFSYWQGEQGKLKLYASVYKKGFGYKVEIDAPTLQSVLVFDKVSSE